MVRHAILGTASQIGIKKRHPLLSANWRFSKMVEARGIEPLSE